MNDCLYCDGTGEVEMDNNGPIGPCPFCHPTTASHQIEHTKQCKEWERKYQEQVAQFESAHPQHCHRCGGWGGHASRGCSVPYGSTWVSLPDEWDTCPDCTDKGLCPWCGEALDVVVSELYDLFKCPHCGWDEENPDGLPEPPECFCWDTEYSK